MRVPARIVASEKRLRQMHDGDLEQLARVATLPGILGHVLGLPDDYSSVAAVAAEAGVIAPAAVGFDICCGTRLLTTELVLSQLQPHLVELVDSLRTHIPAGIGTTGLLRLSPRDFCELAEKGAGWCLENGYATTDDLLHTEDCGSTRGADRASISDAALARGIRQVGTLGAGNQPLQLYVARPENVFDAHVARAFGICRANQIVVLYACGSRAFGEQVTRDYLRCFKKARTGDGDLTCAPFLSANGMAYFSALGCASNVAVANRQLILHGLRRVFRDVFRRNSVDPGLRVLYDVAQNTAKVEQHWIDGQPRDVLVHRKGATRAFGPGAAGLPDAYKQVGQPILLGGGLNGACYLHLGLASGEKTFYSTATGLARVTELSATSHLAGISRPIVKLVPVPGFRLPRRR